MLSDPNTGAIRYPLTRTGESFPILTLGVKINPFLYNTASLAAAYDMCARNAATTNMFITPDDGTTWYVVLYVKRTWPGKFNGE